MTNIRPYGGRLIYREQFVDDLSVAKNGWTKVGTGTINNGLYGNGSTYLERDESFLPFSGSWTRRILINITAVQAAYAGIYANNASRGFDLGIQGTPANSIYAFLRGGTTPAQITDSHGGNFYGLEGQDVWITWTKSAGGTAKLYINDTLEATSAASGDGLNPNSKIQIGARAGTSAIPSGYVIKQVEEYSQEMTASEIAFANANVNSAGTLDRLKSEGKVYFNVDFRKNSLIEDISQASPTTTTTSAFTNYLQGRAYYAPTTDSRIAYASNTALDNLTEGVIVFFGDIQSQVANEWLLSKRDAGGTSFELYFNTATAIAFSYGGGLVNVTASYAGSKMAGVRFKHGEVADFYKDGVYETSSGTTVSITLNGAPLYVGSFFGNFDRNFKQPIFQALILDHSVTDDEIAALYEEFIQSRGALLTEIRNPIYSLPLKTSDSVGFWSADNISAGAVLDTAGNNPIPLENVGFGLNQYNCFEFLGSQKSYAAHVLSPTNLPSGGNSRTIEALVWFDSWNAGDGVVLVDYGNASSAGQDCILFYRNATAGIFTDGANSLNDITPTVAPPLQTWCHYVFKMTSTAYECRLNNEVVASGNFGVAINTVAPTQLNILWRNRTIVAERSYCQNAKVAFVNLIDGEWTDAQIEERYKSLNKLLTLSNLAENTPPTTTVVPTSSPIPFTTWEVKSGSFGIIEANSSKYISAITGTSGASMIGEGHFGTHIFEMNKVTDGTNALFFFGMKNTDLYSTTGQTGYVIQLDSAENFTLKRCDAAALTQIGIASAKISLDTFYKIAVTRSAGGLLKVYAKGGAYTNWTEVISATDTNHTQGNCYQIYQTGVTASYYRLMDYYSMPLTLDQLNNV